MFRTIKPTEHDVLKHHLRGHSCSEKVIGIFVSKLQDLNFVILLDETSGELVRFRVWRREPTATITHTYASDESLKDALDFMRVSGIRCFYHIDTGEDLHIPTYTRYSEYNGIPSPFYLDILSGKEYPPTVKVHSFIK